MTFTVPGYQLDRLLGQGGQAQVFAGHCLRTGERVALKRIPLGRGASGEGVDAARRARTEAALLTRLEHPNLIRLLDFLIADGAAVLVLELAEAGSLARLLRRRDRLSPAEVAAALSPVAAALAHAHEHGVVHCDVSAANVLFTAAGHPKLADLGTARLLGAADDAIGTPAYLDPTVAAGGLPGAASDVFSLGALALHALTGAGPWQLPASRSQDAMAGTDPAADSRCEPEQLLAIAGTGHIAGLAQRLAGVPDELAAVLIRALDPEPCRRGTAADFALDMRASVLPGPVALDSGRLRPLVGRHSVEHAQSSRRSEPAPPTGASAERPWFCRPQLAVVDRVAVDLTHVSRPKPRPVAERAPARWSRSRLRLGSRWPSSRWAGLGSRRLPPSRWLQASRRLPASRWRPTSTPGVTALAGGTGLLVAAAVIGMLVLPATHRSDRVAAATTARVTGASTGPPAPGPLGAGSSTTPVALAASGPAAVLAELAALRDRAYALRRPDLLSGVYQSPALLTQDSDQLTIRIPAGCRLTGLHTGYRQVAVLAATPDRIEVRASATLSAGSLSCAGQARGQTPASGPVQLRISLLNQGNRGFRISAEQLVGPVRP